MACNCVTEKQLAELYKVLGRDNVSEQKLGLFGYMKVYIIKTMVILAMMIIAPILFFYVLYKAFFSDGKISLKDFFGLKQRSFDEYVRKQQ